MNLFIKSCLLCCTLLIGGRLSVLAQTDPKKTPPSTPAESPVATNSLAKPSTSAETGSQNRMGDIPVSLYTGSPVINYPLYTFQEGAITIPISLGYNATGLRAGEVASWCGLGWNLQAGGMITRQVRGGPDEGTAADGQLRKGFYQVGTTASATDDNEPDVFVANINGQVIKFQLNNNHQFQPLPDADIDIDAQWKRSEADGNVLWISNWQITTSDGMKYFFGGQGASDAWEYSIVRDARESAPGADADSKKRVTPSAWYLRRIESPYGQAVDLTYYRVYYAYPQLHDCEVAGALNPNNPNDIPEQKVDKVYVSALVLNTIEGKNVKVSFNKTYYAECDYTDPETGDTYKVPCPNNSGDFIRDDVTNWYNTQGAVAKILRELVIEDKTNGDRKLRYQFNYDYFRGSTGDQRNQLPPNYNTGHTGAKYVNRLKLTSFTMPDGTTMSFSYLFDHPSIPFPGLLTRGIDHWGYFNGRDGARHLIGVALCQGKVGWEAERAPDVDWSKYGTLNKIVLSSGQETDLVYEGHQTWNYGLVGGLRITRIATKDIISNLYTIREYSYFNSDKNRAAGFLSLKPVYRFDRAVGSSADQPYYNTYLYPAALSRSGKPVVGYDFVKEIQYAGPIDYGQFSSDGNYRENFRIGQTLTWFDQDDNDLDVCSYNAPNTDFSHQPWKYRPDQDFRAGNMTRQQVWGRDNIQSESVLEYGSTVKEQPNQLFQARNIVIYNGMIGGQNEYYSKYFFKYRLKKQTTKVFDLTGNNPIENKVEFTYKDEMDQGYRTSYPGRHNQIVKTTTWDSFNQPTDTYTRYAADYDFGTSTETVPDYCYDEYGTLYQCGEHQEERPNYRPSTAEAAAIADLKTKGMLTAVIEQTTVKNGKTLSAAYSRYKTGSALLDATFTLKEYPLTDFTAARYDRNNGDQLIKDSRYKARLEYEDYNAIGMPKAVKATNGARTRTTYGYNDLLPTTVIQNADVTGSQTTQYEHSPLFGVTKTIAPNGIEVRNVYEASTGRLLEVRDRDNKILKKYEYKRKDQ